MKIENFDVVLLCGGKGERLKPIIADNRPKPLVDIDGRVFLDILISYLASFGFRRIILSLGYQAEVIKEYYSKKNFSSQIIFSQESEPLGTGGAIKYAQDYIKTSPFLVMNGDSFCKLDFKDFIEFHVNKKALFSLVLVNRARSDEYGVVCLKDSGEVISFDEKAKAKVDQLINAGIYLFDNSIFSLIDKNRNVSLEYDILPKLIDRKFFGYRSESEFIDIGTPERYKKAIIFFKSLTL